VGKINVKIKQMKDGRHPLPKYAHKGDAGVDFYAYLDEPLRLFAGDRALIPLGVAVSLPDGYELQLRPRSGLALKKGISLCNAPGTVDCGFLNEVGAIIINHGSEMVVINDGERICQGVFNEYSEATFEEVDELDDTERGTNGFGSTGV